MLFVYICPQTALVADSTLRANSFSFLFLLDPLWSYHVCHWTRYPIAWRTAYTLTFSISILSSSLVHIICIAIEFLSRLGFSGIYTFGIEKRLSVNKIKTKNPSGSVDIASNTA